MSREKTRLTREGIAMRIAKELPDGAYVNLGIGIPTLVANFTPPSKTVIFHSESGILNCGPLAQEGEEDIDLINAGGEFMVPIPGMAFFDSTSAFAMIRGGHIDVAVLGSLQVSECGDLANWMIPSRGVGNIGGAMDLAAGAKRLIVAMEHTDRQGGTKLVKQCSYPLTAKKCVDLVVTDIAVIKVTNNGLRLEEAAPGWTADDIQEVTEPRLEIADNLIEMTL